MKRRKMTMKTSKWDVTEFMETKEDIIAHLTVALEENDIDFLLSILNALARSKGMAQIASELGVSREGLYKSLTPGSNPAFGTVVKTLDNLGFRLNIELKHAS
jgi:probable addiction module antidote protein